jgi:hypothetical protein
MEIVYRNTLHSSKQKPFLLFVINGKLHLFSGRAIPGIVSVKDRNSFESGATVYTLQVSNDIRVITSTKSNDDCICDGLSETLGFRLSTWTDYADALNVEVDEISTFINRHWPISAEKINLNTKAINKLLSRN